MSSPSGRTRSSQVVTLLSPPRLFLWINMVMFAFGTGLPRSGYQAGPPGIVRVLLGSCHSCCKECTNITIELENRNAAINKFLLVDHHTNFALSSIVMHAYALQQKLLKQICSVLVLKRQELELTARRARGTVQPV
jgi:hypothetical protein